MTFAHVPAAVVDAMPRLSATAVKVAVAIASYQTQAQRPVFPSVPEIMARSGIHKPDTITKALRELRAQAGLQVKRRPNVVSLYWWEPPRNGITGTPAKGDNRTVGTPVQRGAGTPAKRGTEGYHLRKQLKDPSRSRAQVANDEAPRVNAWGLWVDCWRESGRTPDPTPTGPATRAAKELARLIPDRDELADVFNAFLGDGDKWLVSQGHSLTLLPKRVDGYRARLAEDDPPPLSAETVERIEALAAAAETARGGRP